MDTNDTRQKLYGDSLPPIDRAASLRMLDANFNRAAEGLRVVEDYCRFGLCDALLTSRCKNLRHGLAETQQAVAAAALAALRETQSDVGATIKTPAEGQRQSLAHVCRASWQRVQQALRVIEEILKLLAPAAAAKIESLRYESYTLDKACRINEYSRERLAGAKLYVLIDGANSECALADGAKELLDGGVHVLQLRDKQLDDRALLCRARLLRRLIDEHHSPLTTHHSQALLILNDRPDIAVLARADGVHVGQEELTVADARQIVGPDMLIGVSTHTIEQARQAVLDGANYLGCGPTFPSATKQFDRYPGLDFLRQVAGEITLPAFAIGGLTVENLASVLATGFTRVAVRSGIAALSPTSQVASFLSRLSS
jgi:thiamine-phosphate pyrophosphorylase